MRGIQSEHFWEMVRYAVVGAITTVVSLGSYFVCVMTFLDPADPVQLQAANVISWVCAVSFAYVSNRRVVFRSSEKRKVVEAGKFFAARVSTLLIDMGCMAVFVSLMGWSDKISKLVVQVIVFSLNYLFSKFLVFRKRGGGSEKTG